MFVDKVTGFNFYPIKSTHAATVNGEPPVSLPVGRTGFEVNGVRDRDFVLFDKDEGCFVSQRGLGKDEGLRYRLDRELAAVRLDVRDDHVAVASRVGLLELANAPTEGNKRTLDIFGKQLPVVEQGPDASHYFSMLLRREVMLVRSDRERPRMLPEHYQRAGAFNQVAGADGYPFLLVSEASLSAAHSQSGMPPGTVPISRYRGNIVIAGDGIGAFREDYINGEVPFHIGDIGAWAVKACSRCSVPNNDQETGEIAGGGLRVLRGRTGRIFTGEEGTFFGQNIVHANAGVIAIGDQVVIDAMSPVPNIEFRNAA